MSIQPASAAARMAGVVIAVGLLASASGVYGGQQVVFTQPGASRDRLPPPRVGTSTLSGRVADAVTGSPVARARVRIIGGGPRPSVLTDASGRFVFAQLPAGAYSLSVEKAPYQTTAHPDRGRGIRSTSKPLTLVEGQTLDSISIPLYRGGVITGRVVDANGDPLEWAQVRAYKVPAGAGNRGRLMAAGGTSTNDLGEFRLPKLDTASYLVMATPQQMGRSEEPGSDGKPQPQPAPAYYPDAATAEQAQLISVQRGQTVSGIDITLGETLIGVITGTVVDPTGLPVTSNGRISISNIVRDGFGTTGSTGTSLRPDGTFRANVTPGDYIVEAGFTPPATAGAVRAELAGSETVTVTSGSVETVVVTVGRGASATGRVVFDGTSPPPRNAGQVHVPLMSTNGRGCRSNPAELAADWSFTIEDLAGTCTSMPMLSIGRWMLKAVIYNGEDLQDRPVTFKPGQQYRNVQVVFTDRRSEIAFRVTDDAGQATREYVALVFPSDKARWPVVSGSSSVRAHVPPQTEMSPPRPETIAGLRPGEYLAIALDNIEFDDSRSPDILEKLAERATRITVIEGATIEASLRRFKLTDIVR